MPEEVPAFQRIADEALHLRELGWNFTKIANHLRVDDKTAKKAVAWAVEFEPVGASTAPVIPPRRDAKYQRISARARELHEEGASFSDIAAELSVSYPSAKKAVRYALDGGAPDAGHSLPQKLAKDALRLRDKGWTLKHIAEELGVSPETASKAVAWGRAVRRSETDG